MALTAPRDVLRAAAEIIASAGLDSIGTIWAISQNFDAARLRAMANPPTRSARVYAGLQYGLTKVHDHHEGMLDEALLCVVLIVATGMEDISEVELQSVVAVLFEPPLGKPNARSTFELITNV
jgi:hypothetical protein